MIDPEGLLTAYSCGMFPMARDRLDPDVAWIDPHPRSIIPIEQVFQPGRSLRRLLKKPHLRVSANAKFATVVNECAQFRPERASTWISLEIQLALQQLHDRGYAHSLEVWSENSLVGGLYGIALGGLFIGESMFSACPDASKLALTSLLFHLHKQGFSVLDCQFITDHLKRFGAIEIPRLQYLKMLRHALQQPVAFSPDAAQLGHDYRLRPSTGLKAFAVWPHR